MVRSWIDAKELENSRDKILTDSKNRQGANRRMNDFQDRELWRAAQGQGGISLDEQAQVAEDALRRALYSQRGADAKKAAQNRARAGGIASALDSALGAFGGNGVWYVLDARRNIAGSYNGPLQRIASNTAIANRHLERIANQENRDKQMEKLKELNRQRRAEGLRPLSFNAFQRGTKTEQRTNNGNKTCLDPNNDAQLQRDGHVLNLEYDVWEQD